MTTPTSHVCPQLLLLPLVLVVILAAAAEGQQQVITRPGCPGMCGNISISFPFGIGLGCFRDGFEVLCHPPRAFLADKRTNKLVGSFEEKLSNPFAPSPIELVSISVDTGEARVYAPVSYRCSSDSTTATRSQAVMMFSDSPFAMSATHNVLMGVGWRVRPALSLPLSPTHSSLSPMGPWEIRFACRAEQHPFWAAPPNGSCTGGGCCEFIFPAIGGPSKNFMLLVQREGSNHEYETNPCSYAMLVEKSWYNFSLPDMYGMELLNKFSWGVPMVLDFAVGNASCPSEEQPQPLDYACVSGNSSCANAIITPGYICKCLEHYAGNPYITHGCQDINECMFPEVYPCSNGGICKNRLRGYDCPCKFGMKGDGKTGTCTDVFPPAAKVTVGVVLGILVMAVVSFIIILHKEKRKTKEFFKKNGGPTLEKANVIKLFKKEELKPILKNSNLIGKGCFGEVYKGLLDNKMVAIKKPINGSMVENDQFANEVIIQSQVIHKNIVRLIGCCLEVDAPMLVYEFISQGSFHDILHSKNNKVALNLDARLSIAAESADGLAYMHSKTNIRILHGDVKPANILLDVNFVPKISDFGISRLIARDQQHTGSVIGDMNYMDPLYLQEGLLSEKSDVYSFGVVILELISRRRAKHSEKNNLVKNFLEAHKNQKKATELFDKEIAIPKNLELLDSLAGIAMECLSLDVDQRPTMIEVAERLLILSRASKV